MTSAFRSFDHLKSEQELSIAIRKATSSEESAPKRKHVRACIVYTWDHKNSQAFWQGLKVQPILSDEVQAFKTLITMHRVMQEGHPITLRDALVHVHFIETMDRSMGEGMRGYGPLIHEYVRLLLAKLKFHQDHVGFNGTFEYQEYLSLKATNDLNEGYETISDLMELQDMIDQFQKLIFSRFNQGGQNECRISALIPLVGESLGIYKFITSMLRAMHSSMGDDDALAPLRERYNAQHYRLVKFYYECSSLRYLTSLITVPKLTADPPNLLVDDESAPALPARPKHEIERAPTPPRAKKQLEEPDEINEFWKNEVERQNREYAEQQRVLEEQAQARLQAQQQAQLQAQREFEEQQRRLAEQQRRDQEALMLQQQQMMTQGRMAELERENLNARAQYDQDQLLLSQFDQRVKALEGELANIQNSYGQQVTSRDEQIRALQEQVNTWRSKYEALAKLYSQLRHEHLDLLQKFKSVQLKANSAQEAIDRREKLEREIKTKNLELADMIRERDRALHDKDRLVGSNKDEVEKLKRELRMALDRCDNLERSKGNELSTMLAKYNREMADLEEALRTKSRALEEAQEKLRNGSSDLEQLLRDKEEELEVYKAGMDTALLELNEAKQNQSVESSVLDGQLDAIHKANLDKINDIIDSVLLAGMSRVDEAIYELDSTMQAGNQNASPSFVLSQVEKASSSAMEFATAYNNHIADGPRSEHATLIKAISVFSGSIADVCSNTKGLTRLATGDKESDQLVNAARQSAMSTVKFFRGLQSFRLEGMDDFQKTDVVINSNNDVQVDLQNLNKYVEGFAPNFGKLIGKGDLGDIVDEELNKAADAIQAAVARLSKLKNKPRDGYTSQEVKVHDSILDAALAITNAIARLIKAATVTQQEIVAAGRGSSSRTAYYKKHNRWTEGLISAAKAVANSTNTLIETADGVLSNRNSPEQLIVASNNVAASTAQLVAASRVKADLMSKSQGELEDASKAVGAACRALVRQVQSIIKDRQAGNEQVDYSKLGAHEFKVREMEQQVEILQLENALSAARQRLGEMRKISYRDDEE